MSETVSNSYANPLDWEKSLKGATALHKAQDAAIKSTTKDWFPCYNKNYIAAQQGFKGRAIRVYSTVYDVMAIIHCAGSKALDITIVFVQRVAFTVLKLGEEIFGFALRPITPPIIRIYNTVYPINPVDGQRHFMIIPRKAEGWLGDYILFPISSAGLTPTTKCLDNTQISVATCTDEIVQKLLNAPNNKGLLNPEGEVKFHYKATPMAGSEFNAFASPGGGMVVYSHFMQELHRSINNHIIEEAVVKMGDGSTVTVKLDDVTFDDVMAALLGHEMTHVASRHGIAALVQSFLRTILFAIGRVALIEHLKHRDSEYQRWILRTNDYYEQLNNALVWLESKLNGLSLLSRSRYNEYEADTTGAYMAQQAGFNPKGALYVQEFLYRSHGDTANCLHRHLEFMLTHPYSEHRKRAILAAMDQICPEKLKGVVFKREKLNRYDTERSGMAVKFGSYIEGKAK